MSALHSAIPAARRRARTCRPAASICRPASVPTRLAASPRFFAWLLSEGLIRMREAREEGKVRAAPRGTSGEAGPRRASARRRAAQHLGRSLHRCTASLFSSKAAAGPWQWRQQPRRRRRRNLPRNLPLPAPLLSRFPPPAVVPVAQAQSRSPSRELLVLGQAATGAGRGALHAALDSCAWLTPRPEGAQRGQGRTTVSKRGCNRKQSKIARRRRRAGAALTSPCAPSRAGWEPGPGGQQRTRRPRASARPPAWGRRLWRAS